MEYVILKDKIDSFKENEYCEVYSLEHAELLVKIFSVEYYNFTMKHALCSLGEYWLFNKI